MGLANDVYHIINFNLHKRKGRKMKKSKMTKLVNDVKRVLSQINSLVTTSMAWPIPQDHESEDLSCPMLDRKPLCHSLRKHDVVEDGVMNMTHQN